ncbi:MAG TPA: hypothetical protein EYP07_08690 [Kiloniellaceae bacterium]|nr:hypothetical protein [Kiloniellaceae bacterium]
MRRVLVVIAVAIGLAACAGRPTVLQTVLDGRLQVRLPQGYVPFATSRESARGTFVLRGARAALAARRAELRSLSVRSDGVFPGEDDIRAEIRFALVALVAAEGASGWTEGEAALRVPRGASDREIHETLCEAFSDRWGGLRYTFASFDTKRGIGRCVNIIGTFTALFSRRIGNTLVIADAQDRVEVLILEQVGPPKAQFDLTEEERWELFQAPANAEVAERALRSARLR